ncbi:MAG: hypothetical protein ACLQVL_12535 [Terriglobia bacterium]
MASDKRAFILVFALALYAVPAAGAAGASPMVVEPPAPVHRFLDAKTVCLQSLSIIAMAADVASTHRALQVPGTRELNPLSSSQGALIGLKIAGAGAGLGIAYMMHRTGHYKAERVVPVIFGVPSLLAAAHNSGIHR